MFNIRWFHLFLILLWFTNITEAVTPPELASYAIFRDVILPRPPPSYFRRPLQLSLTACAEECTHHWEKSEHICRSFEYIEQSGYCIMFNVSAVYLSNGYLGLKPAKGTDYYERSKELYAALYRMAPETVLKDQSKYRGIFSDASLEDCSKYCITAAEYTCRSFAYNKDAKVCAVSDATAFSAAAILKEPKYDYYQMDPEWPCNVSLPWNYKPRVIATPRYPYQPINEKTCYFNLEAPPTRQVALTLAYFYTNKDTCSEGTDGVTIHDGWSELNTKLARLCHNSNSLPLHIKSSNGTLTVKIVAHSSNVSMAAVYEFEDSDGCDGHLCQNGGLCKSSETGYSCICPENFTGKLCQNHLDFCANNPCLFNGTCQNLIDAYKCHCMKRTTGKRCEIVLDPCENNQCRNGKCALTSSGHVCHCNEGYTGNICDVKIDECSRNACGAGTCITLNESYKCVCPSHYTGLHCEKAVWKHECGQEICQYGICGVNESGSFCKCFPGFTGLRCEINEDDCLSNSCQHGGKCHDHINAFRCECLEGYSGRLCEIDLSDHCQSNPCLNGTCASNTTGYTCTCNPEYTGANCETAFDSCNPNPCHYGKCIRRGPAYVCMCLQGFTGITCDLKINRCKENPCGPHGICIDGVNQFTCQCHLGYTGRYCDTVIDNCVSVHCNNGNCISNVNGYRCDCLPGFIGQHCEIKLNPCYNHPCLNGSRCIPNSDGTRYICECQEGFTGQHCSENINECESAPCRYGTCNDGVNSFSCTCHHGYTGITCGQPISHCSSRPCAHGQCIDNGDSYTCSCLKNYTGERCENIIDRCDNVFCGHGRCINVDDGYKCACDEYFTGTNCTTRLDPCGYVRCVNGTCEWRNDTVICNCYPGYTGKNCDERMLERKECNRYNTSGKLNCDCDDNGDNTDCVTIDDKNSNSCQIATCAHGQCTEKGCLCEDGYYGWDCNTSVETISSCGDLDCIHGRCRSSAGKGCECFQGYEGPSCNLTVDPCVPNPCNNAGICVSEGVNARCVCSETYTGAKCDVGIEATSHNDDANDKKITELVIGICIIGSLLVGTIILSAICIWRRSHRGSIYFTSALEHENEFGGKRFNAKDIHDSMYYGQHYYREPTTVTDETEKKFEASYDVARPNVGNLTSNGKEDRQSANPFRAESPVSGSKELSIDRKKSREEDFQKLLDGCVDQGDYLSYKHSLRCVNPHIDQIQGAVEEKSEA